MTKQSDRTILNHMVEYTLNYDDLFYSLSDKTRRDILLRLITARELTIKDLAAKYNFTFAGIAKHITVLEKARLITKRKEGRTQVICLNPPALKSMDDYMKQYEALWQERYDRLESLIT